MFGVAQPKKTLTYLFHLYRNNLQARLLSVMHITSGENTLFADVGIPENSQKCATESRTLAQESGQQ